MSCARSHFVESRARSLTPTCESRKQRKQSRVEGRLTEATILMPCFGGASSETISHVLTKSAPSLRGGVQRGCFIYSFVLVTGRGLSVLALETADPNQSHALTGQRQRPPNSPLLIGNQIEYQSLGFQGLKIVIEPSFSDGQRPLREAELWDSQRPHKKEHMGSGRPRSEYQFCY